MLWKGFERAVTAFTSPNTVRPCVLGANCAPRLRMHGAIPPLPHTSSWHGAYLSTGTSLPLPLCIRPLTINMTPCTGVPTFEIDLHSRHRSKVD
jgi:hypothetical protein